MRKKQKRNCLPEFMHRENQNGREKRGFNQKGNFLIKPLFYFQSFLFLGGMWLQKGYKIGQKSQLQKRVQGRKKEKECNFIVHNDEKNEINW